MTTATATRRHAAPLYTDEEIDRFVEHVAAKLTDGKIDELLHRVDAILEAADARHSAGK